MCFGYVVGEVVFVDIDDWMLVVLGSLVKCLLAGICSWRRLRTALMRPAMPAAASRWPMLLLTAPKTTF